MNLVEQTYRHARRALGYGCGLAPDVIYTPTGSAHVQVCKFCNELEIFIHEQHRTFGGSGDRCDDVFAVAIDSAYKEGFFTAADELTVLRWLVGETPLFAETSV